MITIRLPRGQWQFDIEQPLGPAGGFGQVFAGVGPDGSTVAVKRLHLTADEAAHRELQIADRLQTRQLAHIIPILVRGEFQIVLRTPLKELVVPVTGPNPIVNRAGIVGGPIQREDGAHGTTQQVLPGAA